MYIVKGFAFHHTKEDEVIPALEEIIEKIS